MSAKAGRASTVRPQREVWRESFIVSHVPSDETHDEQMRHRLASFPVAVRLSENSDAVSTEPTPQQVHDCLLIPPKQDQIYVVEATKPSFGQGSRTADEWLRSNLSSPGKPVETPPDPICWEASRATGAPSHPRAVR